MPSPDAATITTGPGILYIAPLLTTEPAGATALSAAWPAGWVNLGYTENGSEFSYGLTVGDVTVAELFDPVRRVTEGRDISLSFALAEITAQHLKDVLNGGTITLGAIPATDPKSFEPAAPGAEVRTMLGWQAEDNKERWIFRQCLQTGAVTTPRRKGTDYAKLPAQFSLESPAAGTKPFKVWFAADR